MTPTAPSAPPSALPRNPACMGREITRRGAGPWVLAMSPTGIRPLSLRDLGAGQDDA